MHLSRLIGIHLSALALGVAFTGSVQAGFHSYEGELTVQATSGGDCKDTPVGKVVKIRIHMRDDGSPRKYEGYLEGEDIATGHILGDRLEALEVVYPFGDETQAKGHKLKLSGASSDSVAGELREKSLPPDVQNCNYDRAALELVSAKGIDAKVTFETTARRFEENRLTSKANFLEEAARYSDAILVWQELLALHERTLGPGHPTTGEVLNNLGQLHHSMGQYAKAEPLYMLALAIAEKVQGPEHPSTGTRLNDLAGLYEELGQYAKAEPYYVRALAIAEKAQGPEHSDTGTRLNDLAYLYHMMGRYSQAEPLYVRGLAIAEKAQGPEHPETGTRLNNLAGLYYSMGQYAKAELYFVRALAVTEKAQGPDHPDTGARLNNLAALYYAMGQYAKAEPLYVHALAIVEKKQGSGHPDTGKSLNNLAVLYKSMGQYAKAEPLYVRALAIAEKVRGPEHPETGTRLNNLAVLYKSMGQYAKAEPLYVRALAIAEKAQGLEHPDTGTRLNNLALLYDSMGQYAKAEPLYIRALAIAEKAEGPEHPETGIILNNLALLYHSMSQYEKAEPLAHRAYWVALNAGNPDLLRHTQATLSVLLEKRNEPEAAIFFGKQAVNTLQSMRGEVSKLGKETLKSYDATIDSAYRHLSRLLIASSRLVEAERVLELLKEQEQFEFVRRSAGAGAAGKAPLTSVENSQEQLLERAGAPLAKLHAEVVLTCHRNFEPVIAGGWLGCGHGTDVAT